MNTHSTTAIEMAYLNANGHRSGLRAAMTAAEIGFGKRTLALFAALAAYPEGDVTRADHADRLHKAMKAAAIVTQR